jgi:hypothetical protein
MTAKRTVSPLAFHGVTIRSADPEAAARRCRSLLGWRVLRRSSREIVLGEGPELFLWIRRAGMGEREGVEEIHLAVENLATARRAARPDALGGDSWTRPLADSLALTLREFLRAPAARWRKKRKRV